MDETIPYTRANDCDSDVSAFLAPFPRILFLQRHSTPVKEVGSDESAFCPDCPEDALVVITPIKSAKQADSEASAIPAACPEDPQIEQRSASPVSESELIFISAILENSSASWTFPDCELEDALLDQRFSTPIKQAPRSKTHSRSKNSFELDFLEASSLEGGSVKQEARSNDLVFHSFELDFLENSSSEEDSVKRDAPADEQNNEQVSHDQSRHMRSEFRDNLTTTSADYDADTEEEEESRVGAVAVAALQRKRKREESDSYSEFEEPKKKKSL